jgi:hypothetical protein
MVQNQNQNQNQNQSQLRQFRHSALRLLLDAHLVVVHLASII